MTTKTKTSTSKLVKPPVKGSVKTSPTKPASTRIGFLGLGIMGSAMSGNLLKAGFSVCGFDPSDAACARLKKAGGTPCANMGEVATQVDVIIASLPHAQALFDAANAVAHTGKKGLIVVDTSTLDIDDKVTAQMILAKQGITLLDCPLSGTGAQAVRKDLSVYSSGPAKAVQQLAPVFAGFAKANYYLGEFGNGMKMKLMANLLVAIHNVSTAEVLLFGERFGISPEVAVKVLADGAGGSRMLDVRGPMMVNQSWDQATMKVSVWQKDMKLIGAALAQTHTAAPLFAATIPVYNAAMGLGHAENDTAAVFDVLSHMCVTKKAAKATTKVKAKAK
jgi:3-hydroxyisobutyrate dehydrogenase-like beta-hydroxyacid dehydrogenase